MKVDKSLDKSKPVRHFVRTAAWSGSVLVLFFLFFNLLYFNKTLPNTYFAGIDVSGKSKEEVSNIVANYSKNKQVEKIKIFVGGQVFEFTLGDLGIEFNESRSIDRIFSTFKTDNLSDYAINRILAPFEKRAVKPVYKVDFSKLSSVLSNNLRDFEKEAVSSTIVFEKGNPVIVNEKKGLIIDKNKLVKDLVKNLNNFGQEMITARYIEVEPRIKTQNAKLALLKVNQLNDQQITFKFQFDSWRLEGENLLSILDFYPKDSDYLAKMDLGGVPFVIKDMYFVEKKEGTLQVKLNEENLEAFISEIGAIIDKPKVDATLEFDGNRVTKFTQAQDGRALDKAKVKESILDVISVENPQVDKNIVISLPVEVTKAKIANEKINALGIKELVGTGVSYFAGSIANRAFNIGLGAQLINGAVVPPGEIFSFNNLVGPVSAEQGFKQAYVISKGRTILDDGGGICQVSTTVFRAALNAGLPIVERTAHAYRVSYYEQKEFKPGFDATIWSPKVDLKFKNDTSHHILVQTIVDRNQSKLQVDIYGTADGRRVEISDPILTNRKLAPEPKYEDDPTLPAGTIKQVDFAAEGLTSVFSRKVYKSDNLIIDDTFKSVFRPWQAVYLVGKGG